jgi:hypothetical protein
MRIYVPWFQLKRAGSLGTQLPVRNPVTLLFAAVPKQQEVECKCHRLWHVARETMSYLVDSPVRVESVPERN